MTRSSTHPRARAAGTAAALLLIGAVLGIAADRAWVSPAPTGEMSLTASAMSDRLGLDPSEEARLNILLDSLHVEVTSAATEGPEALRAATQAAHRQIEAFLPPDSRPAFHMWMREHREHMMQNMHPGGMGRGMMGRDGGMQERPTDTLPPEG
ncbi:MAG: hypothetical protein WD995_07635 [Gemmatimonadota bacterium]